MPPRNRGNDEERPLLHPDNASDLSYDAASIHSTETKQIDFSSDDSDNPRAWPGRKKLINVGIIALMAILSPLASSMFTPGIDQIAEDLNAGTQEVIATTTGFVIMLGIGPLILAPLSETFGRRAVYIWCFTIFTLLQIPTALSPNVGFLIAVRTVSGLFGSVGIANGGGTISDMYEASQRAGIFGWYLLGPLLGPTLGPLFGGVIVTHLGWRWIYWILCIVCAINTAVGYFFLRETYVPVLLARKKGSLLEQQQQGNGHAEGDHRNIKYHFDGEDTRPLWEKLRGSMKRPLVIFVQPIVFTMSLYQALIFGTTYSIYTNMQEIFSKKPYGFNSEQIGLLYLGPGLGFLTSVWFLVPKIDTVFNKLTKKNGGKELPEYRLPLANVGAVLIPIGLFGFAWSVEYRLHWAVPITASFFYGIGQVLILNTVQNYYIDSFAKYAASAIAGGSVFRSVTGGIIPLLAPMLFDKIGYGWGISVFGFGSVAIAPAPILFYIYGGRIRERFQINF
jgi:multidrug resistance protein